MEEVTTNQVVKNVPNPTGKGGFGDNPQNRSDGRWSGETSIPYQYNKLIRMKVAEFKEWLKEHPEGDRTVAEELAYGAVIKARDDLKYLVEITDRTSGKSVQKSELTGKDGKDLPIPILGGISNGIYPDDSDKEDQQA